MTDPTSAHYDNPEAVRLLDQANRSANEGNIMPGRLRTDITTQDRILHYLVFEGKPQPTQAVMAALTGDGLNPDSVKKALYRMQTAGLVVGFRLFGGYQTYWTPTQRPGDDKCTHPVTYRTEQGQQCAVCGRTVTVR